MIRPETRSDPGVAVHRFRAVGHAFEGRSGRWLALAAVLLGLLGGGGCVVPQNIEQYEAPPENVHRPITLHVENVSGVDNGACLNQDSVRTFQPRIYVTDDGQVPLTARWFLNYAFGNPSTYDYKEQDYTPNKGEYGFISITDTELGLAGREPGIYGVEVVVSDGFDTDLTAAPARRSVQKGYNVATYKWVIEYRGTGSCPIQ